MILDQVADLDMKVIASLYRLYVHSGELFYNCIPTEPLQTTFLEAAGSGDTARVTELVELVGDINTRNKVCPYYIPYITGTV